MFPVPAASTHRLQCRSTEGKCLSDHEGGRRVGDVDPETNEGYGASACSRGCYFWCVPSMGSRRTKTVVVFISANPFLLPLTELCGFCRKPLSRTQPAVRALDCLFHVECFTCFKCEKQLQGQQFYNVDEKPFCEDCYAVSHWDESCWRELSLLWLLSFAFPFSFHLACVCCSLSGVGDWINVSYLFPLGSGDLGKVQCLQTDHHRPDAEGHWYLIPSPVLHLRDVPYPS